MAAAGGAAGTPHTGPGRLLSAQPHKHQSLARALLGAVRAQDFGRTADALQGGAAVAQFPSIDLALIVFKPGTVRWANVLFSREHPHGLVAEMSGVAGAVSNVRFDADQTNAQGDSIAWLPGADWSRLHWTAIAPDRLPRAHRFVAPYPASLLKLLVALGVALAVDRQLCDWPAALESMIVVSDNDATTDLVALLHRVGMVAALHERLAAAGLATLQLNDTRPDGGWRNGDGSGVGHIHMTAWDTARLLWLLDPAAPPVPWLAHGSAPLLQAATRARLFAVLQRQQLDHVLSSGALHGVPGWLPGLPDAPRFAHKTGNTQNYASDAGILQLEGHHAIVAVLTNLGSRYAPPDASQRCVTTWRLPALGAALLRLLETGA